MNKSNGEPSNPINKEVDALGKEPTLEARRWSQYTPGSSSTTDIDWPDSRGSERKALCWNASSAKAPKGKKLYDDNDLKYTGCYQQTDKWKKNYYIKPPQQHQKTYKPEMLYPFDHGTIYYKGATSGPAPIPSFRAFPLYVYSAPLLSSRVSKRVNYLGC